MMRFYKFTSAWAIHVSVNMAGIINYLGGGPLQPLLVAWVPMRMRVLHRAPLANNRGNLILERAANLRDAPILRYSDHASTIHLGQKETQSTRSHFQPNFLAYSNLDLFAKGEGNMTVQ